MKRRIAGVMVVLMIGATAVHAQGRLESPQFVMHRVSSVGIAPLVNPELERRLASDSTSGALVVFGAVTFSSIAGAIAGVAGVTDDRPKLGATIAALALGGGAVAGARMGRRRPAYLYTLAGASVGGVPLILAAREPGDLDIGYAFQMIGLYSLSVFGAWLGNTLGQ